MEIALSIKEREHVPCMEHVNNPVQSMHEECVKSKQRVRRK